MKARVVKVDGMWCVYSSPKFTKKEREDQEKIERGLTMYVNFARAILRKAQEK